MSTQPTAGGGSSLPAALRKNQKPLMIGGAVLVAALGYAKYRSSKATGTGAAAGTGYGSGYTVQPATGQAAYDSTGTDVYNALQPQVEQTQGMLQKLLDASAAGTLPKTTPPPATNPGRLPTPPAHHAAPPPRKAPAPAHKAPATHSYTVRKGDNLTTIGHRYGVSWQTIYKANRGSIHNPNLIHPGQRLVIPHK